MRRLTHLSWERTVLLMKFCSTSRLMVLGGVLLIVCSIQVLPQVDLPDAAFHRNTEPLRIHAKCAPPRAVVVLAVLVATIIPSKLQSSRLWTNQSADPLVISVLTLDETLRC